MTASLGAIRGQITLDVRRAIAAYTAVRLANAATTLALARSSAAFAAAGKGMGLAGLAIGAGFVYAVKKAADFERQLDFFGAVSGSTEAQMEKVRVKALQLGQDTRFSAGEIADSFVELGKAGVSAEQIVDGVGEAVANLGAAADIPLEKAAQIMTSAVQTFELKAQDATHVADLLAGAANASIVEIEDLGVSLKYVGGVAAAISLPIEDVIDGLALLGKYGIRGSTAGTSLRQILVSLSGTSKKASGELKKLGIITKDGTNLFFDAEGKAKPLADIFQILQDKTKGLTEAQRLAAFKIIFNNRALAAASVLSREGAKGFANMNKEIAKTTAAEVAAKRLDNLSGDIEILKGNLETLFIKAGSPFQEFLRGITQGITDLTQSFANLDPSTQSMIFKIIAIAGAVLLFMSAVAKVISIVIRFVGAMRNLWQALVFIWNILKPVLLVLRTLGAIIAGVISGPVALAIAIIAALVTVFILLWNNCEGFRNFFIGLGKKIVEVFQAVLNWFQNFPANMQAIWDTVRNAFISGWEAVVNFFTVTIPGWFTTMVDAVTSTVSGWYNSVVGWFQRLPGAVSALVSSMVDSVVNFFAQLPSRAGYWIGFLVGRVVRFFIDMAAWVLRTADAMYNGVVNFFQQLPGRVVVFLAQLWVNVSTWFTNMYNAAVTKAGQIIAAVVSFFAQLPGRASTWFSATYTRIVVWMAQMAAQARAKASQIISNIGTFLSQLPGKVTAWFAQAVAAAIRKLSELASQAGTWASTILSNIRTWVNQIPGVISSAIGNAIQAFKDMVGRAFQAAKDFAAGLWEGFKDGLGINSPSFIEKQMVQITDVVAQETATLRAQIRQVQSLGNKLTNVPTMEPTDQTLVGSYAASLATKIADEYAALHSLQEKLSQTASTITSPIDSRVAQSLSAAAVTAASALTPTDSTQTPNTLLVKGELGFDESGQAYIRGTAQEVYDANASFDNSIARMGS